MRAVRARLRPLVGRIRGALPQGRSLPQDAWEQRHRAILWLLWLHVPGVGVFAGLTGWGLEHALEEAAIVAVFALLALLPRGGRRFHAISASLGLLTASAILVHLSGGYIEVHFHFFVMLSLISLYQDWPPFLIAIAYVVGQHGLLGALDAASVYNHPAAIAHPWWWALVHGAFVLGASIASIFAWRAHEDLRAETELILGSAGEGIYGIDAQGHATFVNPAAARMSGWEIEELLGRPMHAILHHSHPDGTPYPAEACPIYAAYRDGEVHQVDNEVFWRKDGRRFPVEYVSTPIRQQGRYVGAVVTFKDITERRHAEAALAERARLAALGAEMGLVLSQGETLPAMLQGCAEALVRHLDVAVARIWALNVSANVLDLQASAGLDTRVDGPDGRVPVGELGIGRIADGRRPLLTNALLDDPGIGDGEWARRAGLVAFAGYPLTVEDRLVGVMAIFARHPLTTVALDAMASVAVGIADALERRRTEEALRQSEDQLRQSQKMEAIGRLAGGVAHDFNNLLTVISGRSNLLLRYHGLDGEVRRSVELIHKTALRAANLTHQLLAFSRKQVLQPKLLDLNVIVSGVAPMLRRLIGEDIDLVIMPGASLGVVKADPGQLEQVILNLAVNARDAMPAGGRLTIATAWVQPEAGFARRNGLASGPYVTLAVQDTGVGMDAATQARIFEPFFTTKGPGKGTGLGLAVVDGIVRQSGGYLEVESAPGRGTAFRIYLPRVAALSATGPAPRPWQTVRGCGTILVVEDEDEVRRLACEVLTASGYTLLEARQGHEALELSSRHGGSIDLLLTDVVMPQMSGPELAARLGRQRRGLKVLYMSGYTADALGQHRVLDTGVALLLKPFTPEHLAERVCEILTRRA